MSSIRRIDVETWLTAKRQEGLSGSTLSKAKSLLNRLFASGVDNGIVLTNPVLGIRSTGAPPAAVRKALTHDQVDAIVDALPEEYRAFVMVLAYCGLRPGEAIYLRRRHLTAGNRLLIEGALVESHGQLFEGPTKTGKIRTVPMTDVVQGALADHLATRPDHPDTRIFVTDAGADIRLSNFRRVLRRAAQDAGIGDPITPYNFRHTCASLLAQGRVPVSLAANMLGHHPNVFLATYAHIYDGDLDTAAQALEASRNARHAVHLRAV